MKNRGVFVRKRAKASFDPKKFLAKVGEGKTISKYRKDQIVFSQGQVADAVFYIQQGKVKLTVVSEQGKEAVVAKKVTWSQDGNHRFLALLGNDGELDLALLDVKNRVRDLSLRENNLILLIF